MSIAETTHPLREGLLLLRGDALREVRRIGHDRVAAGGGRAVRGRGQPVVELVFGDDRVADLGDPAGGDAATAACDEDGGN